MQRHQGGGDDSTNHTEGNATKLDITVINTGTQAITVQTRSRQRFLVPRGPMQPEEHYPPDDPRPRIIDTKTPAPAATLQVIDMATETVVREATKLGVRGLYQKHDPRPKLEVLTTLRPGEATRQTCRCERLALAAARWEVRPTDGAAGYVVVFW